jgi:hypothetical protein
VLQVVGEKILSIYFLPKVFSLPLILTLSPVGGRGDKRKELLANAIYWISLKVWKR